MIIDCISDLHGNFPELEGGDLLIVAGDLTARDTEKEHKDFLCWLNKQNYTQIILISGNHDNFLVDDYSCEGHIKYLCDSGTEFEGLKIWGSPWTQWFNGVNPKCKAFMLSSEEKLDKKWALIPKDTDILITHSPPFFYFDRTREGKCVGSESLTSRIAELNLKLHVFGHIHECGGQVMDHRKNDKEFPNYFDHTDTVFVNASIVNENYMHVNKPVRVIL